MAHQRSGRDLPEPPDPPAPLPVTAGWPVRSGAIPPLADKYAMRPETGPDLTLALSRSAVVAQLSTNDLEGIFHLRAVLESEIMARATKVYTDADIAWIQAAWAALERRPEDNAETLSERHIEFHRRLYLPAMNDWDRRLGDIVWQASDRYMYLILGSAMPMDDPMHFRDVHTELLEAARARSARMARRAVAEHLRSGVELLAAHLDAAAGSQLPETAV